MSQIQHTNRMLSRARPILLLMAIHPVLAAGQTIAPSSYWKNQIAFPDDAFCAYRTEGGSSWVKLTILLKPYDPNVVYFQDSKRYRFHYDFAVKHLSPFGGMTTQQFNAATLREKDQQAVLGSVILPPLIGSPPRPEFQEYGIQFVRQDPYTREEIRDMFHLVRSCVVAPPEVQAFYFPTYEQQAVATANRDWLASQGISLGSMARWVRGNTCYSPGWALGTLKFFPGDRIADSYHTGLLGADDILLTDGVPAEVPFVAGIISLAPSTPNSHVAILSRTYAVPFVHLSMTEDAERARGLVGHRVALSAYEDPDEGGAVRLIDTEGRLDPALAAQILQLKKPTPLQIAPMTRLGVFAIPTEGLRPPDVRYVGGKAANFGILREAVPDNSPPALALSFDLWNAFLDQPLVPVASLVLGPGEYMVFWADGTGQGSTHTSFRLSKDGETIALFDVDGSTRLDMVHFGPQTTDVSQGRVADGADAWGSFAVPTPGRPNAATSPERGRGLLINEIMADNRRTIEDPDAPGDYPDWIELYNSSDRVIALNGMYLTDDVNQPTKWQIPPAVEAPTLRAEIASRLALYDSYPPPDMAGLSRDLAGVRSLFTDPVVAPFGPELQEAIVTALTDPVHGFDPHVMLRFRSSTNVEDSEDFIGAGLYDSFSGCLADDLDPGHDGPCGCDPNQQAAQGVFQAIRRVFASFYNDNAYLERLRHEVNEAEVGMAVLVHPSFPDEIELANGVATIEQKSPPESSYVTLVSQTGAVSVTNPRDSSAPEEAVIEVLPSGYAALTPSVLVQQSSLLPVGRTVLDWPADYRSLVQLLMGVAGCFGEVTDQTQYVLDLEYKKVAPGAGALPAGGLVIKQVRQIPTPDQSKSLMPFLIAEPLEFEVFPGEFILLERTDVFADHRLKSRWTLETYSMPLDSNGLNERLYATIRLEYLDGDQVRTITSDMSQLPSAQHSLCGTEVVDTWQLQDLANPRAYHLRTTGIPTRVPVTQNPLLTAADLGTRACTPVNCLTLDVEYAQPVTSWFQHMWPGDSPSGLRQTTADRVYLSPCQPPREDDMFQERSFSWNGISIETSFYYPAPPRGFSGWGDTVAPTAPLKHWGQTVIEGLTSTPIVLRGYYSQTFRPEHHNLIEQFLFEPRLEPGLSADILNQLQERDIRLIHLIVDNTGGGQSSLATYGYMDTLTTPTGGTHVPQ
jgi:hypothetical protein